MKRKFSEIVTSFGQFQNEIFAIAYEYYKVLDGNLNTQGHQGAREHGFMVPGVHDIVTELI
jgi:hypothetical protein